MADSRNLLRARQFFSPERSAEGWSETSLRPRDWEQGYRDRWQHDRIVRSTHGVNCTGSCSRKIHVRTDWSPGETQQVDYPPTVPRRPTTSHGDARAAPLFPGTSTRRFGPSSRTCVANSFDVPRGATAPGRPGRGPGLDRR